MNVKVGFIGGGNMAEAFIEAFILGELLLPSQLSVSDVDSKRLSYLKEKFGVKTFLKNQEVVLNSDVIFLAVKPQVLKTVLSEIKEVVTRAQLLISMAAGFPIRKIEELVGDDKKVVRIMPNIMVRIRKGVIAYADNKRLFDEEEKLVKELLSFTGKVFEVPESLFDAVTALGGSSPAFLFVIIEALCDGGVRAGLSRELSKDIVLQVLEGAAQLAKEEHPELLKDKVTSPGGTTIEGLSALEERGIRYALNEAVRRATQRSREISRLVEEL
jgi:pyrroline-5-carboxylate reductase